MPETKCPKCQRPTCARYAELDGTSRVFCLWCEREPGERFESRTEVRCPACSRIMPFTGFVSGHPDGADPHVECGECERWFKVMLISPGLIGGGDG